MLTLILVGGLLTSLFPDVAGSDTMALILIVGLVLPAFVLGLAGREVIPAKVRCRRPH
jgi:hypothetical protein